MIDLDANFLISVIRRDPKANRALARWVASGEEITMSSIAWSEFLCGPVSVRHVETARTFVERIEPFTAEDAALAAELFNETGRRSRSHADCMIAASAIGRDCPFATLERSGFVAFRRYRLKLQPV